MKRIEIKCKAESTHDQIQFAPKNNIYIYVSVSSLLAFKAFGVRAAYMETLRKKRIVRYPG